MFSEFTYGDRGARARKLRRDLRKGDYVFFHGMFQGRKCITAYYVVDRVVSTREAVKSRLIKAKYKNPHLELSGRSLAADNSILFGDPITSRKLDVPLEFTRGLARKLSLGIRFLRGKTESQSIGSATRSWRELTGKDVRVLLREIEINQKKVLAEWPGLTPKSLLSTDEVSQFVEKDLESLLARNPKNLGGSMKVTERQLDTDDGRIDLLLESRSGQETVVELKLHRIGREAVSQLRRYMRWIRKTAKNKRRKVRGIILCEGVLPSFEEDLRKLKDIEVFRYGWNLNLRRLTRQNQHPGG
jgi:hypothetical protein